MRSLKSAGVEEVRALRKRTLRVRAMGRIDKTDCDFIVKCCDEIESRIVSMQELDPERREF